MKCNFLSVCKHFRKFAKFYLSFWHLIGDHDWSITGKTKLNHNARRLQHETLQTKNAETALLKNLREIYFMGWNYKQNLLIQLLQL